MSRYTRYWAAMLFVAMSSILTPRAEATNQRAGGDVIIEWNQLLQQNIGGPPFVQVRGYTMLHIAMADAVLAIDGRYDPFHARLWAPHAASAEAAAAQAGHDVFVALVTTPAALTAADALLQARLAAINPGARFWGTQVGKRAAQSILDWRQNDGYATANPQPPTLAASTLPGIWRPTASGAYQFSEMGTVEPFGLMTPTQFLPRPFPQLESAAYATAFNEVKRVGRIGASLTDRTEEQTRFAQLFAGVGANANVTNAFRVWGNVARDLSQQKSMPLAGTSRLFAMMYASMNDGVVTSHTSKAVYRLWRPETAIANADIDNNDATVAEPGWVPLIPTPPYPAYASNMTCLGTGASRMLANVLGDDAQTFTATWYTAANVVVWAQPYTSLWKMGDDQANSRIWGGIHYRFDIDESQVSCTQVADYLFDNFMQPDRKFFH
jgi:hypothetical protein